MPTALLLLALVVVVAAVAVASGRVGGGLPDPVPSSPHRPLPPGPLRPEDVDGLQLSLAVRGYRMDEVDAVLARLRDEIAERDARLEAVLAARTSPGAVEADRARDERRG